jgi:hypothetical protein
MKMVPIGTAITPYKPGRGAGMKAVVKVASDDKHPKVAIKTKSFESNNLFTRITPPLSS